MGYGDVGVELGARVAASLRAALGVDITPEDAVIRPSTRDGVDYQCNAAMALAKTLGRPPREVAQAIVDHLDSADLVEDPQVAGPGFINFTLRGEWLSQRVGELLTDDRLGAQVVEQPRRYALDYSSPNVAKEMHVGHLRSSILGDALARMLRFQGHEVVPHNHVGDWGTPFGMLIEHLVDQGWKPEDSADAHSISDLNSFYQDARKKFDADADFADRSRRRVVALQAGDEATLALWRQLVQESTHRAEVVADADGADAGTNAPAAPLGEQQHVQRRHRTHAECPEWTIWWIGDEGAVAHLASRLGDGRARQPCRRDRVGLCKLALAVLCRQVGSHGGEGRGPIGFRRQQHRQASRWAWMGHRVAHALQLSGQPGHHRVLVLHPVAQRRGVHLDRRHVGSPAAA